MKRPPLAPVIGKIDPAGIGGADCVPQMPRMPWYPRDFASATRGWPLVARGAYRELLDCQWDMASLPENPQDLRAIAAASPKEWTAAWPFIESKFPIGIDGRRRNPRLEAHRVEAVRLHRQRQAGAAATNASRWSKR